MTYKVFDFPPLSLEILKALEKKVDAMKVTADDCLFIDYHLIAIGEHPDFLQNLLKEEGADTFFDVEQIMKDPEPDNGLWDWPSYGIAGRLLSCIRILRDHVLHSQKIL
jgi:hypothetical protein